MAKEQKIKAAAFCYVGGILTPVSELNDEQRERLAVGLRAAYLNEIFLGRAVFSPPPEFTVGQNERGEITVTRATGKT